MRAVNERAAASWVARILGRQSAADIGSHHPGRLWVAEIIDHSPAETIELGERVMQYIAHAPAVVRMRLEPGSSWPLPLDAGGAACPRHGWVNCLCGGWPDYEVAASLISDVPLAVIDHQDSGGMTPIPDAGQSQGSRDGLSSGCAAARPGPADGAS